jgi:HJR/Mrr/RecB family endonuclease
LASFEDGLNEDDLSSTRIDDVDNLSGSEFELFLKQLFVKMGYSVINTKLSGDQGADLIIEKFGTKIAVQAKNYGGKVSNKSVQEVVAAIKHYEANKGMVVTNNFFTKSAYSLAESNNVDLVDRNLLEDWIRKNL